MLKKPKEHLNHKNHKRQIKESWGTPSLLMAKESWGISTTTSTSTTSTTSTTVSSVTSALLLEARASEARLLLALKNTTS